MKLPKKHHFKLWIGAVILPAAYIGLAIILPSSGYEAEAGIYAMLGLSSPAK